LFPVYRYYMIELLIFLIMFTIFSYWSDGYG